MIDLRFIKGDVHKNLLANEIEILKLLKNVPHILEFYEVFNTKNRYNIYILLTGFEGLE